MFSKTLAIIINIMGVLIAINALTVTTLSSIHQIYVTANLLLAVLLFILAKLISKN